MEVAPGRYGKVTIDNQSKFPTALAEGYFANLTAGKVIKNIEPETAVQKLSQIALMLFMVITSVNSKTSLKPMK